MSRSSYNYIESENNNSLPKIQPKIKETKPNLSSIGRLGWRYDLLLLALIFLAKEGVHNAIYVVKVRIQILNPLQPPISERLLSVQYLIIQTVADAGLSSRGGSLLVPLPASSSIFLPPQIRSGACEGSNGVRGGRGLEPPAPTLTLPLHSNDYWKCLKLKYSSITVKHMIKETLTFFSKKKETLTEDLQNL